MSEGETTATVPEIEADGVTTRYCKVCKTVKPIRDFRSRYNRDKFSKRCHACVDARRFTTRQKTPRINDVDYQAVADKIKKSKIVPAIMARYIPNSKEHGSKDPKQKMKVPTKQLDLYKKAFLNIYELFLSIGVSEADLTTCFGISNGKVERVKIDSLEGNEAYQAAMKRLQEKLAAQVLVHGLGFDYEESKITSVPVTDQMTGETMYVPTKKETWNKHYTGDSGLIEFYMTNKFPDLWKKSSELVTRKEEGYSSDPADRVRIQIESLARDVLAQHPDLAAGEHRVPIEATLVSGESDEGSSE